MSSGLPSVVWDHSKYEFQKKLGRFVQYFQVGLPVNGFGIPLQLIHPLTIAECLLDCHSTDDVPQNVLDDATLIVDIDEMYPTIDGVPIWDRLEGETIEYFKMFKEYREMLYITGSRAITQLAATFNIEGRNLQTLAKVYHWPIRCRAYDLYKKSERERIRQYEIEKLESKHARAADVLLEQSLHYLENHPEQLNPKIALQMLHLATRVGRLALGMNPDKPSNEVEAPTTITVSQSSGDTTTTVKVGGSTQANQAEISHLQSVLHILDKSGALDKVKNNVIDADYTPVD